MKPWCDQEVLKVKEDILCHLFVVVPDAEKDWHLPPHGFADSRCVVVELLKKNGVLRVDVVVSGTRMMTKKLTRCVPS